MTRRTRARSTAVLAALAVFAGCTGPIPSPSPSAATSSAVPSVNPTIGTDQKLEATGHVPRVLDTALLDALPVTVDTRSSLTNHLYVAWPEFDREVADTSIRRWFNAKVDDFVRDYSDTDPKAPAPPELNLGWHLVASSPSVIGIVADGFVFAGASGQNVWQSMWFDPASDRWLDTDDLVDTTKLRSALADAAAASDIEGIDLAGAGSDPVAAATLIAFRPNGDLIVGFDECAVAACSSGRVTLTLAKATTDSLLTDAGRAAQAATMNPVSPVTGTGSATPSSTAQPSTNQPTTPRTTPSPPPPPARSTARSSSASHSPSTTVPAPTRRNCSATSPRRTCPPRSSCSVSRCTSTRKWPGRSPQPDTRSACTPGTTAHCPS